MYWLFKDAFTGRVEFESMGDKTLEAMHEWLVKLEGVGLDFDKLDKNQLEERLNKFKDLAMGRSKIIGRVQAEYWPLIPESRSVPRPR